MYASTKDQSNGTQRINIQGQNLRTKDQSYGPMWSQCMYKRTILHRDQLQKRCRVCGSLLVAKGKKRRAFYQCSELKECLLRAFSIDINNDLLDIHPVSLCYSCKQIMDRPMTCYSSTAITEWEVHAEDRCMVSIST